MSVAALIPAFNSAAFIEGTLASVFAQTRNPDEVIVVDDASTDDTAAIARRMGATVIVLENNSGGPAKPLNVGIAAAKSQWIATLDHDDRWVPGWLAAALPAADDAGVQLVFGRVRTANAAMQFHLDARLAELETRGERVRDDLWRLPNRTAYNELVPSLNYAVTCSNMVFTRNLGEGVEFDGCVRRCCDYRFLQEVTLLEDVAMLRADSCDWTPSAGSLYQNGDMNALDRELLYVFAQFHTVNLEPAMKRFVRDKCRRTALDLAYEARERGEYGRAFRDYASSMIHGGVNRTALAGILKLPVAMLRGKR